MNNYLDIATPFVAQFEGCARKGSDGLIYPYYDKYGKVWTRGYGRTYGIDENSPAITKDEAIRELRSGLSNYALKCLLVAMILRDRAACLAAVTSWAWNCGVGAFRASRLRIAINEERWDDAIELIKKPRTASGIELKGLVRRRNAESALFASGVVND
jgi:lysozyme